MTQEEFKRMGFFAGMKVTFKESVFDVEAVDFEENLIAIDEFPDLEDEYKQLSWKRCENCEIVE